jgi:hypothetical protein
LLQAEKFLLFFVGYSYLLQYVSRGHFRVDQTISETRNLSLGVKIQI